MDNNPALKGRYRNAKVNMVANTSANAHTLMRTKVMAETVGDWFKKKRVILPTMVTNSDGFGD